MARERGPTVVPRGRKRRATLPTRAGRLSRAAAGSVLFCALPAPAASQAECADATEKARALISGTVAAGEGFEESLGERFTFRLRPSSHGWEIQVGEAGRDENLARLTPPWHFVPNPRFVEGWHFRNARNTGPNEGDVNAPQRVRHFIFSPEVGRSLEYEGSATPASTVEAVAAFGQGRLTIMDYELSAPEEGTRARFESLRFEVCLYWSG